MAHTRHHAIIVVGWPHEKVDECRTRILAEIEDLKCPVTAMHEATINGEWSFAVLPDGGNYGREHSSAAARQREQIKEIFESYPGTFQWIEVSFADDWGARDAVRDSSLLAMWRRGSPAYQKELEDWEKWDDIDNDHA